MTLIISGNETTTQDPGADDIVVTGTGSIVVASGAGVSMSNGANDGGSANIFGTIVTEGAAASGIQAFNSNDLIMRVGATGSVVSTGDRSTGVTLSSNFGQVINEGLIEGGRFGVFSGFVASEINNLSNGTIIGGANQGAANLFGAAAVYIVGSDSVLNNAGMILAEESETSGRSMAVVNATTTNTDAFGFSDNTNRDFLFNNTGDVFGEVFLAAGEDTLNNAGFISERVDMGLDDDVYNGRGGVVDDTIALGGGNDEAQGGAERDVIEGGNDNDTINGRAGDDVLRGGNGLDDLGGGSGDDSINGGGSNDVLRGSSGDDTLNGNNGNDTLRGGSGSDEILGEGGNDNIYGGAGNDEIDGGGSRDTVRGHSGDDSLNGGAGNDSVTGGAGDDTLVGGAGRDTLIGGSGDDVFLYASASESPNTNNRDVIRDFRVGEDQLDLSGLGNNLSFIGTAAFSGTTGEVRATTNAAGDVFVRVDTTGNGSANSRILLEDVDGTLGADDFIF